MPRWIMPVRVWGLLLLALSPLASEVAFGAPLQSERWYEQYVNGQKSGFYQVVWAPSTWEGRKTVHDTTRVFTAQVRNMIGTMDRFTTSLQIDLERGADGTLWWQRYQVEEAGRIQFEELRWTGKGYDHVAGIVGEKQIEKHIALDQPVMVDSESYLGHLLRAGKLETGQTYDLRMLNVRAERAEITKLSIAGKEDIKDEHDDLLSCFKIVETNPRTKTSSTMWLDKDGAFVRIRGDDGRLLQRVSKDKARDMPAKPAELIITTPATPHLERVFSADRHLVDLHVQGDEHRSLPEIPHSPWSRVLETQGNDDEGWILKLELAKYDSEAEAATLPVDAERFADDLEPTVLMQTDHPTVQAVAKKVVGDEQDLRKAAYKLARHVFTLNKTSPAVGQASALEIIASHCGDCSEHALLFVTLCRAAGIPARRCSGYVNIGSDWGAHAWAEIWTGQWIAADPTTGELGGGARYLFFGYSDRPDSHPGVVSSRLRGRMRFLSTRIEEGAQGYDLTDPAGLRRYDPDNGRFVHVLAGLEARDVPSAWTVRMSGAQRMQIQGDDFNAMLGAVADQGYFYETFRKRFGRSAVATTFGGAPALLTVHGSTRSYQIFSRRRRIMLQVSKAGPTALAMLEKCLAATFADTPPAWPVEADEEDESK